MPSIFISCTASGNRLDTGIKTTAESLSKHWDETVRIYCPYCKTEHVAVVRDAFTADILSDHAARRTSPEHLP